MRQKRLAWKAILLLAVFALVAAACGDDDDVAPPPAPPAATDAPPAATAAPPAATAAPMDFGEPVTLTLGHPFPEAHPIHQGAWLPYADAVSAATNGAVTIEIVPGGGLAALPATYDNTVIGGQDMGWALHGYHAGVFAVTEIMDLPFQFSSAAQATQTMWALHDEYPALQDDYADVKMLGLWTHEVGDLFFNSEPVTTLEQLDGMNLRFSNGAISRFFELAGASPVGMGAPGMFDALSTGVLDGIATATSALQSFGLYPVIDYITRCECFVGSQYLVMNIDTWNSLTPDTQSVMETLAREYSLTAAEVYDGLYVAITARALEEGVEELQLTDEERARWHELGDQVIAEWIAEREAQGVPAQEMFDRLQELKAQFAG